MTIAKKQWKDMDDLIRRRVFSYLGLQSKVQCLLLVDKSCHRLVNDELSGGTKGKLGKLDTANDDLEGQSLTCLLDYLRYWILKAGLGHVSKETRAIVKKPKDMYLLRHSGLMEDLLSLNASVYSYWDSSPAAPDEGCVNWVEECLEQIVGGTPHDRHMKACFYRDVIYFKEERVFNHFMLLFDTPGGAILVEKGFKNVYRVLGIRDTIGYVVGARDPFSCYSRILGVDIITTLLPWNGDIVYDGLVACGSTVTKGDVKKAIRAYVDAVDRGTLITSFSRTIKKVGMTQKLRNKKSNSYSGPSPDRLKVTLSIQLDCLTAIPLKPSEVMWVFRRHGYTEQTNPMHGVSVISSSGGGDVLVPFVTLNALAPTVEEYVHLLMDACRQCNNRRPVAVAVDDLPIVEPLREVLSSTGVVVHYYPPPSDEELVQYNPPQFEPAFHRGGPHERPSPPPRFAPGAKVCHLCLATAGSGSPGDPLMQCSRCKKAWYCSKEHQKIHWRVHKKECF